MTAKQKSRPLYAAILAGGVGARLWPRSRQSRPKQFTDVTGNGLTMLQETVARLTGLVDSSRLYVITGAQYAALVADQLPHLPLEQIILEPSGRNTAPAVGLAAAFLHHRDPDAILALLHSDHVITDVDAFQAALARAADAAEAGHIATLGIEPTSPHTGYGYIRRAAPLQITGSDRSALPVYGVAQFLEKPSAKVAQAFLAEGGYYWNGGIFVSRVSRLLAEYQWQLPDIYAGLQQLEEQLDKHADPGAVYNTVERVWQSFPTISMDHGIMERAVRVAVVPLDAGWNDVGSWDALTAVIEADESANYVVNGRVLTIDSSENIIYSDKQVIAMIGVQDLVVIDAGDCLLIGHKGQMQRVKEIVDLLRDQGRTDLL